MTMTWKDFKKAVEDQGVKDETKIEFIDWGGDFCEVKVNFTAKIGASSEAVESCDIT